MLSIIICFFIGAGFQHFGIGWFIPGTFRINVPGAIATTCACIIVSLWCSG